MRKNKIFIAVLFMALVMAGSSYATMFKGWALLRETDTTAGNLASAPMTTKDSTYLNSGSNTRPYSTVASTAKAIDRNCTGVLIHVKPKTTWVSGSTSTNATTSKTISYASETIDFFGYLKTGSESTPSDTDFVYYKNLATTMGKDGGMYFVDFSIVDNTTVPTGGFDFIGIAHTSSNITGSDAGIKAMFQTVGC